MTMQLAQITSTYAPCGHTITSYGPPDAWRRVGDRYWCAECNHRRRLVSYSTTPATSDDAGASDAG